tara:strand:+ start:553 stop:684 length:132 start_codon:yes stop_codon:yes gene_type:complete
VGFEFNFQVEIELTFGHFLHAFFFFFLILPQHFDFIFLDFFPH